MTNKKNSVITRENILTSLDILNKLQFFSRSKSGERTLE